MADKPLWEVMIEAYEAVSGSLIDHMGREQLPGPDREECAAMLRAIADAVVPERQEPPISPHMGNFAANAIWRERMGIRDLLIAEAERAERAG
jgi:hypothetical protein